MIDGDGDVPKKHCNFRQETVTFEPRHENKSCSACPEDQLKPFRILNFKFKFLNFKKISGSQLLSDFQTFFLPTLYMIVCIHFVSGFIFTLVTGVS